jgi:hypothetical protein
MATAMLAETLDNFQHSTLLTPESRSFTGVYYRFQCIHALLKEDVKVESEISFVEL